MVVVAQLFADLRSGVRMLVKYPTLSLVAVADARAGHRPQHDGLLRRQRRPLQGAAVPRRRSHRGGRRRRKPSQNQPRQPISVQDLAVWQAAADVVREDRRVRLRADEPVDRRGPAGAVQRRAAHRRGVRGAGRRSRFSAAGSARATIGPAPSPSCSSATTCGAIGTAARPTSSGKTIRANGVQRTVIGVMPERFAFPDPRGAVDPACRSIRWRSRRGQGPNYQVIARLKPGVSIAQAKAQAATIAAQLETRVPGDQRGRRRRRDAVRARRSSARRSTRCCTRCSAPASACCSSPASTSRTCSSRAPRCGGAKSRCAWRSAPGAHRVVRQHLTEVLVLATAGGGIGIVLSIFGMRWFTAGAVGQSAAVLDHVRAGLPRDAVRARPDRAGQPVCRRAAGAARGARERRRGAQGRQPVVDERRASAGSAAALVVAELAVSCGLLIAAGLMIKSVVQLKNVQMPFAIENILTARVDLPRDDLSGLGGEHPLLRAAAAQAAGRSRRRGGHAVGRPAGGRATARSRCRSKARRTRRPSDYPLAREGIVTAGYFETFQTPLLERPRVHDRRTWRRASRWRSSTQSFARHALPEHRSGRPPDEAHPARTRRSRG